MGFSSIDDFVNKVTNLGQFWRQDFIKLYAGGTAIAGNWYDLTQGNGNPAQYLHGNLVLNADLVTSQQPWVFGSTNWTYDLTNHRASRAANADVSTMSQTIKITRGMPYMVVFTIVTYTAGGVTPYLGGTAGTLRSSAATFREIIVAGSTDRNITITPNATANLTVDLISVQPIYGGFVPYNDLTEGAMWHGGDVYPATKHVVNYGAWTNAATGVASVLLLVDILGCYPRIATDTLAVQALGGFDRYTNLIMHDCQTAWNEQVISNVTNSVVTKTTEGVPGADNTHPLCVKLAIGAPFTTGIIASRVVALATTSFNYVYAKYVYFWIRSSIALNAGDLSFCTDEHANLASSQDVLLPAISQNVWTEVRLDVSGLTATDKDTIISLGLKCVSSKGQAYNLYIDDVRWALSDGVLYNGNFAGNATGWTLNGNWGYSSNDIAHTNGDVLTAQQDNLAVYAKCPYRITFTITGRNNGSVRVSLGGTNGTVRSTNAQFEEMITCGSVNQSLIFTPSNDFDGHINNVICAPIIPRCDETLSTYGSGVRMFFVMDNALTNGANASTVAVKYTNQANIESRNLGATVNMMASDVVAHLPHTGVGAGKYGPFLPLQAGDSGIQQVDQFQFSVAQGQALGAVDLLVCKFIAAIPLTTAFVAAERDLFSQVPSLPRVRDGACLMFLHHAGAVTASGTAFMGYCDFAWG